MDDTAGISGLYQESGDMLREAIEVGVFTFTNLKEEMSQKENDELRSSILDMTHKYLGTDERMKSE